MSEAVWSKFSSTNERLLFLPYSLTIIPAGWIGQLNWTAIHHTNHGSSSRRSIVTISLVNGHTWTTFTVHRRIQASDNNFTASQIDTYQPQLKVLLSISLTTNGWNINCLHQHQNSKSRNFPGSPLNSASRHHGNVMWFAGAKHNYANST